MDGLAGYDAVRVLVDDQGDYTHVYVHWDEDGRETTKVVEIPKIKERRLRER